MPLFKSVSRFLGGGSTKKKQSSKSSNNDEPTTTRYNNHDYDELEEENIDDDERYILNGRKLDYAVNANHDDNDDDDDDATNSSRYHLSEDIPSREETTSSVSSTDDDGEVDDANAKANENEKEVEEPSPAETNSSSPSTGTNNSNNDNNNTSSTIDGGDDNNDLSFVGYEQEEEKKNDDDDKLADGEVGMASRTAALASVAIMITTATDDSHNKKIFRRQSSTKIKHEVTSHLGSYWEVATKKEEETETTAKTPSPATATAGTNNDNDNDHNHDAIHSDGCSSRMTRSRSRQLSKEIKHEHNTNNNMMIMMPPSMMMNTTSNSTAALSPRHTSPYDDKNGGDDDNLTVMSGLTEITNHWNSSTTATATATTVVGYSGSEHQLLPTTPTCDRSRSGGSMTSFGGCSRNSSGAKKMEDFLKSETESIRQLLLPTIESSSTTTSSSTKNSSNTTPKHRRLERTYSESSLVADESSRAATEAEAMAKDMERVLIEEFSTTEPTTTTTKSTLLYHNNDDAANIPPSSVSSSSSPSFAAKGINTTVVRSSFGSSSEILTGADILSTMHPKQTPPSPLPLLISPLEKRQQSRIDNDDGINNKRRLHRRAGRYLSSWIKAILVSVFVIGSIMVTIGCSGVFVRNWGVTYNFELNNIHNAVQDSKDHVLEGMILTTKIVSTTKYYYVDEQMPERYIPKLHDATRRSIELFQTTKVYMQAQILPMVEQTAHRSLKSALATKSYIINNYCVPPLLMDKERRRWLRKSMGQLPSIAASYLTLTDETKGTVLNRMKESQSYMQDLFTSIKVVTVPTITTIVQNTKAYIFQSISNATNNTNTVYGASFTSLRANLYSYVVDRYEYTFTDRWEQETRIEEERKLQALLAEATAKAATQAKEETQHQMLITAAFAGTAAFLGSVATNYLFV